MFTKSAAVLGALALPVSVLADGAFHTASYYTSYFTQFNGTLINPSKFAGGGTPYIWPGLQPPDNSGVLQPVLDGRNSNWYFGNAYVGSPSEPYGGGQEAGLNEKLGFAMVESPVGSGNWYIESNNDNGGRSTYTFNVDKRMNQALFAVELYDNSWDFGNVVFQDVTVVAQGTDTSWCTASPQYSNVTIEFEGVSSSSSNGFVTCFINQITLSPP